MLGQPPPPQTPLPGLGFRVRKGNCQCEYGELIAKSWRLYPRHLPAWCITKLGLSPSLPILPRQDGGIRPYEQSVSPLKSSNESLPGCSQPLWQPSITPRARVELGCTQGQCLELVGYGSQEKFQVGDSGRPDTPPSQQKAL